MTDGRIAVNTGTFNFDAAGTAAQALVDAKAYTDAVLTWHETA